MKKTYFRNVLRRFALRFAIFQSPRTRFAQKEFQFGNPQAIRANLRIDLRESGHLSFRDFFSEFTSFFESSPQQKGDFNKITKDMKLLLALAHTPLTNQGGENPVFGKPWFCLRDTRHFRHFHRFPGSEERNPLFLWVECKSSFSPFFVKTTCFQ